MGDCVWFLPSLSVVGIAIAAIAAIAAWKSAKATKKTVLAQIIIQITDAYSSREMMKGIENLHAWKRRHGTNFAKKFREKLDKGEAKQLDEDRRRYSHHFHQIRTMSDCGVVNESFVKKLVKSDQVDTLLDVIQPLEEAKDLNYDRSTFDFFRGIYHKES